MDNILLIFMRRDANLFLFNLSGVLSSVSLFLSIVLLLMFLLRSIVEDVSLFGLCALWFALTITMQLSIHSLFKDEYSAGVLEQMFLQGREIYKIVFYRIISYWIILIFPLLFMLPFACIMCEIELTMLPYILLLVVICSLIMIFVNSIGAALVMSSSASAVVTSMLTFPVNIPIVIFGVYGVESMSNNGLLDYNYIFYLCMLTLLLVPSCVALITTSFRAVLDEF